MVSNGKPFRYFGGKGNLVYKLLQFIPEHKYYIEAFGGGASLLFAKKPVPIEIYNDIDKNLFTFFRVLQDPKKFMRLAFLCNLTPYSRDFFNFCKETLNETDDEVERAWKFWVMARQSYGGTLDNWNPIYKSIDRGVAKPIYLYLRAIENLERFHERMRTVVVENKDWYELLNQYEYDFHEEFIYLDPPYLPETRKSGEYANEMTYEDHEKLISWLIENTKKRRAMLSGYDNKLYQNLEKHGWKKICFEVQCHIVGKNRAAKNMEEEEKKRIECIWINYDIEKQKSLFGG